MDEARNMGWDVINLEIKRCRSMSDVGERIRCLKELFERTQDGMVAFALGEELEACGNMEEALQYFEKAETLFPLARYKEMAKSAISRIREKIQRNKEKIKGAKLTPPSVSSMIKLSEINLNEYDQQTTLFVVACSKTKIWDINESAPEFVPARMAYQGDDFKKFLKWVEESGLEQKGFRWLILSAKYGYIEPWHPICNYSVTFSDGATGPISDETLCRQVLYQTRWGVLIRRFRTVICVGNELYFNKVKNSFKTAGSNVIRAST